jgi:hypothetical protein
MAFSMYQAAVPAFLQVLDNLSAILDKAEAHCTARKIAPEALLQFRLYPDMLPLVKQVQIATDAAKGLMARLAGVEVPSYPDTETTFDELRARLAKTIDFVKSFKPEQLEGSESRTVILKIGGTERSFVGDQYLVNFVLPNVFFHVSIAYAILRHCGVELGKKDFLGN